MTRSASREIFRDLRNDHIRLVNLNGVSDPQFQFFHDADIVHAGAANRRPLQFHRLKNRNRIDQSRS